MQTFQVRNYQIWKKGSVYQFTPMEKAVSDMNTPQTGNVKLSYQGGHDSRANLL